METHTNRAAGHRSVALALAGVLAALLAGCADAVHYAVDKSEVALMSRAQAASFLDSLHSGHYGVHGRLNDEHCEFTQQGLRVANGTPQFAKTIVTAQEAELRGIASEREALSRDERKLRDDQRSVDHWLQMRGRLSLAAEQRKLDEEHRSFEQWMVLRGRPNLVAEERKLDEDHRSAERWLRLRGMPADQIERGKVEMAKEKADLAARMSAAREDMAREKRDLASRPSQVNGEMAREREAIEERRRDLTRRQESANRKIAEAKARVHDLVPYRNAGFVLYKVLTTYYVDIDYRVPGTNRIESCGLRLFPSEGATVHVTQDIVNALAALGAEPQIGTSAHPPLR